MAQHTPWITWKPSSGRACWILRSTWARIQDPPSLPLGIKRARNRSPNSFPQILLRASYKESAPHPKAHATKESSAACTGGYFRHGRPRSDVPLDHHVQLLETCPHGIIVVVLYRIYIGPCNKNIQKSWLWSCMVDLYVEGSQACVLRTRHAKTVYAALYP